MRCPRPFVAAFVAALVVVAAPCQRGAAIAEALRRSDRATAESLVATEPMAARRALYEAVLQPIRQRAGAFLSVAQRHPIHEVCGEALLAGCAVALVLQRRWPDDLAPLPELLESLGDEWWIGRHDAGVADELVVVLPALLQAVRQWEGERPRAAELPLLQRLARLCACQVVWSDPLPIEGEPWPLPRPLGEDLLISLRQLGDALPTSLELVDTLTREGSRRWFVTTKDTPAALPSPGAGRWLLEVQSVATPWRALRVVDVGALRAAVLVDKGVLVFGALDGSWQHDEAIAWSAWRGNERLATEAKGGIGVWRLDHTDGALTVQVRRGNERARVPIWVPPDRPVARPLAVAHWHCDRPLHRPGETVPGRVVVRTVAWRGAGLAAVPTTAALAPGEVPFVCKWPDGTRTQQTLTFDAGGIAAFELAVAVTATPGPVHVAIGPLPNGATLEHELTEIVAFRRPAVVGELRGPQRVAASDGTATVRLHVTWASGGPAAAVPVDVAVGPAGGWQPERRRLATGADGALVVPIAVRERPGQRLACTCTLHGPDGQVETLVHEFAVDAAKAAASAPQPQGPATALGAAIRGEAVVGQQVALDLRGPAWSSLLVAVGRGQGTRVVTVTLARDGSATHLVDVLASDWPRLDIAVAADEVGSLESASAPVRLAPSRSVQLVVPSTAQPKQTVRCRASAAPGSVVTFAVVDDRMFRLREDPTRTPDEALRPFVERPQWSLVRSRAAADPRLVFGGLLVDGKVPGPGDLAEIGSGAGGTAGPSGPAPGAGALRIDFRATACFRTLVADDNGVAELAFELPDDVTTWRVTVSAVDGNGEGSLATATIASRLPLVAEAQLPRVVRVGDRVEVPLVFDRAATTAGDDSVRYAVAVDGAAQREGTGEGRCPVARGTAATVAVPLVATQVGTAVVRSEAELGAFTDRSERRLPVLPDAVEATLVAAAAGREAIEVMAPADATGPLRIDVLAGGAAAWRELAQRLQEYPYGCVEQTLSRLLPYAVGAAIDGDPAARADRLGKGLARLRQLQRGDGAFAWWPAGEVDLAMTGLVLHGLAALRAGGVDPRAYGLRIDAAVLLAQVQEQALPLSAERVELLAGLLRFHPDHLGLREAAASLVDAGTALPRGTALRLSLAFVAAGDRARATRCRRGLPLAADRQAGFPGADSTVHLAHELELDRALGDPIDPAREMALVQQLLGAGCRTYTDAVTLVALGPSLAFGGKDVEVAVEIDGGGPHALVLPAAAGLRATHRAATGNRVVVRCNDARQLLFVRVASSKLRPGTGPGWAVPIVVERTVSGPDVVPTADGSLTVRAGEPVRVTLRVETPVALRYVALVCPLPAGCEVIGEAPALQRFDDRVVVAWPTLAAQRPVTCSFDVVATLPGVVAWPSAIAEPMYEPTFAGGSAGGRLVVLPRLAAPPTEAVAAFLEPKPQRAVPIAPARATPSPEAMPASLEERIAAAAATIQSIWFEEVMAGGIYGFDTEPSDDQRAELDAALALLEAQAATAAPTVLQQLEMPSLSSRRQRGAMLAPWRLALLRRLWLLQEQCLDAAVAHCERHLATEDDHETLAHTLQSLPQARAEAVAMRILSACWPGDVDRAVAIVEALPPQPYDERLLGQLTAMLRSGHEDVIGAVLARLPAARLEAVAPSVLVGLLAALDEGPQAVVVRALSRSSAGRLTLQQHLLDAAHADDLRPRLWPDEACRALPASAWAVLAANDAELARARLASSDVPTATLWRWLLARGDGLPLDVLVGALRARRAAPPAEVLAAAIADPTVTLLRSALAAEHEPSLVAAVIAAARPFVAGDDHEDDVEEALTECIGELVAAHGDVATVKTFASWLSPTAWRTVWRRLDASAAAALLHHDQAIGYGLPGDDPLLAMLLTRAWRQAEDAVMAIGGEPDGLVRLQGVRTQLPPPVRSAVDTAIAEQLGFDVERGEVRPDAASCVVPFAAQHGWAGSWPTSLHAPRAELLRLCGLQ